MTRGLANGFYALCLLIAGGVLSQIMRGLLQMIPDRYLVVIFCLAVGGIIAYHLVKSRAVKTLIHSTAISTQQQKEKHARKGLIVFLSLYAPTAEGRKAREAQVAASPSEESDWIEKGLANMDYEALLINNDAYTNFGQTTRAIRNHLSNLRFVWIVGSESKNKTRSSSRFYDVYHRFLKEQVDVNDKVEFIRDFSVNVDEDSQVCKLTSEVVQDIYKRAAKMGLSEDELIIDVTPGTKSMTTGAILGSIAKERDVQVIAASHQLGSGVMEMNVPVIIEYEAKYLSSD